MLLWRLGREEEAQEDLAWAWKRRRRLDARVREQLRAVRREMRRRARQEQAERGRPIGGAEETGTA
ncbi:MAG: hypothetical protein GXO56_06395 [Chloroflexi bacterium]|nr:hypothetical protein [Chloroflexota bacterium]